MQQKKRVFDKKNEHNDTSYTMYVYENKSGFVTATPSGANISCLAHDIRAVLDDGTEVYNKTGIKSSSLSAEISTAESVIQDFIDLKVTNEASDIAEELVNVLGFTEQDAPPTP